MHLEVSTRRSCPKEVFPNIVDKNTKKFEATWKGPYMIDNIARQGASRLMTLDEQQIPRSWNATHLKAYQV